MTGLAVPERGWRTLVEWLDDRSWPPTGSYPERDPDVDRKLVRLTYRLSDAIEDGGDHPEDWPLGLVPIDTANRRTRGGRHVRLWGFSVEEAETEDTVTVVMDVERNAAMFINLTVEPPTETSHSAWWPDLYQDLCQDRMIGLRKIEVTPFAV